MFLAELPAGGVLKAMREGVLTFGPLRDTLRRNECWREPCLVFEELWDTARKVPDNERC